jgi:hypothetical protein
MRASADAPSRVLPAVRYSVLVIGAIAAAFAVASGIVRLGTGVPAADAALMLIQRPLITGTVVICGALTLFLLTVSATPTTRWGFAWRGAAAASVSVVVAPLLILLTTEWIPAQPGAAGGFFLVISAVVAFALTGGPLWAGLIAILLRRTLAGPRDTGQDAAELPTLASRGERRRLGLGLCAAGAFVALGITFLVYVPAMYQGADYKCLVEGPNSPLAEISERPGLVTGSFSLWPLGRDCTWQRADGMGTVTVDSGNWVATGFAASAALLALVGAGLAAAPGRAGAPARSDKP